MPSDADKSQVDETYYRAAIAELFAQMDRIDERIKRSQSETGQLRAQTWEMLGQIQRKMGGGRGQAPPQRGRKSGA